MQQPLIYTTPLLPGGFYHIFNRGNNYQDTFKTAEDYYSFLNKWREYIHPVAKTFAYCLMPNHFHALVQIRDEADLLKVDGRDAAIVINRGFTNFFISYSRTMQNRHGFHGAVFHSPFKRKAVDDDMYFEYLMAYIHFNPLKHGIFSGALQDYPFSSYRSILSEGPTLLEREYILKLFGGRGKFIAYHDSLNPLFDLGDDLEP